MVDGKAEPTMVKLALISERFEDSYLCQKHKKLDISVLYTRSDDCLVSYVRAEEFSARSGAATSYEMTASFYTVDGANKV